MKDPIEKLMNAKSIKEVDEILLVNWEFFIENPGLLQLAKHSKKRIKRIEAEKRKAWFPMQN